MPESNTWRKRPWLMGGLLLIITLSFALAYAQSPLYTSNQNQYFLHGLAKAGLGYLDQDWLANTLDPTPVFSYLVYLTYRLTHQPALFYLYYAILLGIYLFSLLGIANQIYHLEQAPPRLWLMLTLLFVVHSAALRFGFSRLLGDNWTYILEDGLADQRLLGPVFQPSTFGVLLLVSIYLFLKQRPFLGVLCAALAATIHPTYLLSAGALTLAYIFETYRTQRNLLKAMLIGLVGLLCVAPILFYVYTSFANTPAETSARAQEILVNFRIPFHAVVQRWFDWSAVVKVGLMLLALYLVRRTQIFWLLLLPFVLGALLTIAQLFLDSNMLALLFPWRISTVLVPLSVTIILAELVSRLFTRFPGLETQHQRALSWICLGIILSIVSIGVLRLALDFDRKANIPERGLLDFVAANHKPDQYYMIPLEMQDFRLATGSPIYVEFKSIPYRDRDVLEWARRLQITDLFYKKGNCPDLEKLAKIGITHVVATPRQFKWQCDDWLVQYQDDNFALYEIR